MKKQNTLTLLKGNIDNMIISQIKKIYEPCNETKDFDCELTLKRGNHVYQINVPYQIIGGNFIQSNKDIRVYDDTNEYCIKNENLTVCRKNQNPNKLTVQQALDYIIEADFIMDDFADEESCFYHPDSEKGGRDYENDKKN